MGNLLSAYVLGSRISSEINSCALCPHGADNPAQKPSQTVSVDCSWIT